MSDVRLKIRKSTSVTSAHDQVNGERAGDNDKKQGLQYCHSHSQVRTADQQNQNPKAEVSVFPKVCGEGQPLTPQGTRTGLT